MKIVRLICGHEAHLRVMPIEGEELWCTKCVDWMEYTAGMHRALCPKGLHRMTPFNVHQGSGRNVKPRCRRCYYNKTGEHLVHGA